MTPIKLYQASILSNGTIRLQSQLYTGGDSADFIIKDGKLMCYDYGERGFDFYPSELPYEIITDIDDMKTQQL